MHPDLIHLGPLTVKSYGVMMAVAFLLVIGLVRRATVRSLRGLVPMDENALVDWAVWALGGGILGGRLLYILSYWDVYADHPLEILAIWKGGLIWYGGFLGGTLASWLYLRRRGYGFLRGIDQVIPFVTVGHAIGRIGCFLNGCCYGRPTTAWFGVRFPELEQPVIPTQLIESAGLVVLALLLRRLQTPSRLRRPGSVFGAYLVGYSLLRWAIEWWRADQPTVWPGITVQQLISLVAFVIGLRLLLSRPGHHRIVTSDQ